MKKNKLKKYGMVFYLIVIFQVGTAGTASSAEKPGEIGPVVWWKFNTSKSRTIADDVSKVNDSIQGNFKFVNGVDGKALKLDGFTTCVTRKSNMAPGLGDSFTLEGWIAAATYPWNWCPLIAQVVSGESGYYFGVGPQGQVGIFASVEGAWQGCESLEKIELKKWTHVVATFDKNIGLRIYINGELSGHLNVKGHINYANEADLIIGMNNNMVMPSNPVRTYGTIPAWFSFDGIYDEIKIYDTALSDELIQNKSKTEDLQPPDIQKRVMPSGPEGKGRFGAYCPVQGWGSPRYCCTV
jgi:hypothetical protein